MVSPEHIHKQKPEDKQAPDPAEGKHISPVSENKRPWLMPLLRVVAIVASLIGGIASVYLVVYSFTPYPVYGYASSSADQLAYLQPVAYLLVGLVALGGAVLFRSWWALLFVPLAIGLGVALAVNLSNQIAPDLVSYDDVGFGVFLYCVIYIPIIAVIGALIGSYFGMLWKQKRQL